MDFPHGPPARSDVGANNQGPRPAPNTQPFGLHFKQFWPTTCFMRVWEEHPREAPAIVRHLYELKSGQTSPIASGVAVGMKSAQGLYEGTFDLLASPHPSLVKLRLFIVDTLQQAIAHLHGDGGLGSAIAVEVVDSWFHITNGGGFHDAHFHGGCSWCGIYYLQVGDGQADRTSARGAPNGGSRFYSPLHRGGSFSDFGTRYLDQASSIDAPIRDGLLLLFPSYLLHSGLPYTGAKDRIVIAFNTRSLLTTGR